MLDGATLLCCAGSPLVLFQVSVEKPFSLSCALNILLLHVVLCEFLNEREDFFTLNQLCILVCFSLLLF